MTSAPTLDSVKEDFLGLLVTELDLTSSEPDIMGTLTNLILKDLKGTGNNIKSFMSELEKEFCQFRSFHPQYSALKKEVCDSALKACIQIRKIHLGGIPLRRLYADEFFSAYQTALFSEFGGETPSSTIALNLVQSTMQSHGASKGELTPQQVQEILEDTHDQFKKFDQTDPDQTDPEKRDFYGHARTAYVEMYRQYFPYFIDAEVPAEEDRKMERTPSTPALNPDQQFDAETFYSDYKRAIRSCFGRFANTASCTTAITAVQEAMGETNVAEGKLTIQQIQNILARISTRFEQLYKNSPNNVHPFLKPPAYESALNAHKKMQQKYLPTKEDEKKEDSNSNSATSRRRTSHWHADRPRPAENKPKSWIEKWFPFSRREE